MNRRELAIAGTLGLLAGVTRGGPAAARTPGAETYGPYADAPLFAREVARAEAAVRGSMREGVAVPFPKDPGGGYTHEQHKKNYRTIHQAGRLFRITGNAAYAAHARSLLLAYAELYPTLGPHPANRRGEQYAGRLFWQTLNDSVFLVHAVQGWGAIRDATPEPDRAAIDDLFRRMARFLSDDNPRNFDQIHNHATWATCGVGLTGYVLGEPALIEKALLGTKRDGAGGFLRQIDELFSPDGYYEEGPYYQRYALMPFVVFAREIEREEPGREIFERRGGLLLKAVRTAIDLTYAGRFIPINDAIKDKSLDTEELHQGVAIAYARTRDPAFLAIAEAQGRTVLTGDGLLLARDLAAGKAKPWPIRSRVLRDGPDGTHGALVVLRSGEGPKHLAVVAKNTAQGMGHGHFDKLNWLLFDNGREIVRDYGAARFLNIEMKGGGRYLEENESWAKQTVAHNALAMDERSHFDARLEPAEAAWPEQLWTAADDGDTQISCGRMTGAYPGVTMTRTLALVRSPLFPQGIVFDLLRAEGPRPARWDLPLWWAGRFMQASFPIERNVAARPVLGPANGYQHLWVDGVGRPAADGARLTWLEGDRFYSFQFLPPPGAHALMVESGANDPNFNLRREPALIQRAEGAAKIVFCGALEPHGLNDGAAEVVQDARPRLARLERFEGATADVVMATDARGRTLALGLSADPRPGTKHSVRLGARTLTWTGPWRRFDG